MQKPQLIFLISIILILVIGCASEDDDDSVVSTRTSTSVVDVFPPDATTDVPLNSSIYVTFDKAVEPTSMTANTSGANCYGEIQVSKDDFSTCLNFVNSPAPSNENTTFTVKPESNLEVFTDYKLKICYNYTQDSQGNLLTREQTSGFTTGDTTLSIGSGFSISAINGTTTEDGAQASFDVALRFQPTADVILPISSSDTTEGTVAVTELTFDTFTWNTTQTVVVTGVDDSDFDGNQDYSIVLGVASSSDSAFNGMDPADVGLTNSENEVLQITSFQFLAANNTELTFDALIYINQTDKTISAFVPVGTVVTALIPTITINAGSVTPLSEAAQNFTNPLNYSISLNGLTTQGYTVSANEPIPPSDTQQTLCYNESGGTISCPPANNVMAQDGSYQTDPDPRFTAGSGGTAGTVTDNQTGLVWEQGNSSITGTQKYTWTDAPNYCASLNSASLGSYTDWRLPNKTELSWIVKNEGTAPFINSIFTGTVSGNYWTSTSRASDSLQAWLVAFDYGSAGNNLKINSNYVRCVRHYLGHAQSTTFVDNGDQTISDQKTGLMWQKCSQGQSGSDCSGGSATAPAWTDALSYCETQIGTSGTFAGYSDWRVPNRNELQSIVDDTKGIAPMIDTTKFPGTLSFGYWASTSYALDPTLAWYVHFNTGYVSRYFKTTSGSYWVRCVR